MFEASNKVMQKRGLTLPPQTYMDLSASVNSTQSNFNMPRARQNELQLEETNIELLPFEEDNSPQEAIKPAEVEMESTLEEAKDDSFCGRFMTTLHFIAETAEYKDPVTFGWRIKFRRIFLTLGTLAFTFQTIQTAISTQNFSSKEEIQDILDYMGANLTWPDSGSVLDQVFDLYNQMERTKSYLMIFASFLFWIGLIIDCVSPFKPSRKNLLYATSRIFNFLGSLTVFASVIIVGLPDYLEEARVDTICPFCGLDFNQTVEQIAKFSIGLSFACLFTFQLIPILGNMISQVFVDLS